MSWLSIAVEHRPSYTPEEVLRFLEAEYGLRGALTPLPAEVDQNFRLDADDAGVFVVKLANRADSVEVVACQTAALELLAEQAADLPLPRIIPNLRGESLTRIQREEMPNGAIPERPDVLRLLGWLEGKPLSTLTPPRPLSLYEETGRMLGRLDRILRDFRHPGMNRRLKWDLAGSDWISAHTGRIADRDRRGIVERWLLQCRARVLPLLAELPWSVIHNDGNDENLLVGDDGHGGPVLTGLLDFGDMLHTATVSEPAVAATYAMLDEPEPLEVAAAIVSAYHSECPLTGAEIGVLLPLIGLRLCLSVVSSALAADEEPDNVHRLSSEPAAREMLERLEQIPWAAAEQRLRDACGFASGRLASPGGEDSAGPDSTRSLLAERQKWIGPALSLSYSEPLAIVRGRGQFLFDLDGRAWLDCVNNVCHVGHSHPRVVEALSRQAAELNTNTRYLHPNLTHYAERLVATFPEGLEVCYFVNSGSEANELAVRMALTATGRTDAIVLEGAYHGNTRTLVELSPYKCEGPGGQGLPDWVHKVPKPDPYRGPIRGSGPESGKSYAEFVREACERLAAEERPPALFIAEPMLGCGGQIVPPEGYLRQAFAHARQAGAVCIADEVQVGFGRVGSHWWAFAAQGALPDIVTLGKPIGNGHPIGAVVTTHAIAEAFDNGMEYFSTFGGNPVSCAVGLAVLDVMEEENLREKATRVGTYLTEGFRRLAERHTLIGDVRGLGMFLGVELVRDRQSLEPATEETAELIEVVKADGILLSAEGPFHNVLKIKPPLAFDETDADLLLGAVSRALTSLPR